MDWLRWIYREWNQKLAEYVLAVRAPEDLDVPVERITATPEELVMVAGVDLGSANDVVEGFLSRVARPTANPTRHVAIKILSPYTKRCAGGTTSHESEQGIVGKG